MTVAPDGHDALSSASPTVTPRSHSAQRPAGDAGDEIRGLLGLEARSRDEGGRERPRIDGTWSTDLPTVLEGSDAWIGFTGSGGAAYQVTNVLSWTYIGSGPVTGDTFRRGDVNLDTAFDISDAVFALAALFTPGSPAPGCVDSADTNDDGTFDISDAVFALAALFTPGSPAPPAPGPATCGVDPTPDALDCATACP